MENVYDFIVVGGTYSASTPQQGNADYLMCNRSWRLRLCCSLTTGPYGCAALCLVA